MSSKVDITDIVKNRAEVCALLKKTAHSKQTNGRSSESIAWIAPHERHLPIFKYDSLDDPESVKSLVSLHSHIFKHRNIASYEIPKLLMTLENPQLPDSSPPRPSLDEVQGMVESGFLNIAIYSTEGYNYTMEYAHVYNGESTPGIVRVEIPSGINFCARDDFSRYCSSCCPSCPRN